SGSVLVDMWAFWCPPCRALCGAVDQLAYEFRGQVAVGKFDIDAHGTYPDIYKVTSIPSFILFHNGEMVPGEYLSGRNYVDLRAQMIERLGAIGVQITEPFIDDAARAQFEVTDEALWEWLETQLEPTSKALQEASAGPMKEFRAALQVLREQFDRSEI